LKLKRQKLKRTESETETAKRNCEFKTTRMHHKIHNHWQWQICFCCSSAMLQVVCLSTIKHQSWAAQATQMKHRSPTSRPSMTLHGRLMLHLRPGSVTLRMQTQEKGHAGNTQNMKR
jgi:hypothetical protein